MVLIRWNETIDMWFRPTDCDLIFNDTFADEVLVACFHSEERDEQRKVWIKYTPGKLNELEFIAFAANHAEDRNIEHHMDKLYDRLERIERTLVILDDFEA